MDPTIELCQIRDSFKYPRPDPITTTSKVPIGFTYNKLNEFFPAKHGHFVPESNVSQESQIPVIRDNIMIVSYDPINIETIYSPNERIVNITDYNNLNIVKDSYSHPNFITARNLTNPFENIGKSIFMDRAAIKLANIDSVFGILGHNGGLLAQQTLHAEPMAFLDLAGGPGSFTQYIQFRIPQQAKGLGISLSTTEYNFQWRTSQLDMNRFATYEGMDKSGNLNTQGENFLNVAKKTFPSGIELVVADGGIETQGKEKYQEILSLPLILSECMVGVNALKTGGNFICKIFDSVMDGTIHLLFLLSVSFESIIIFKPMSSRPGNSERYIICRNKREDNYAGHILLQAWQQLLPYHRNNNPVIFTSLVEDIPISFLKYIEETNKMSIDLQLDIGKKIILYLSNQKILIPEYNLYRALIVWNLPDNIPPEIKKRDVRKEKLSLGKAQRELFIPKHGTTQPGIRSIMTPQVPGIRSKSPPRIISPEMILSRPLSPRSPRGISQGPIRML